MKSKTRLRMAALPLVVVLSSSLAQAATTLTNTGTTAPTVDGADILNDFGAVLESSGAMNIDGNGNANSAENDGLTYLAGDRPSHIQSFTTGANVGGYSINAFSIKSALLANEGAGFLSNGTWANFANGTNLSFSFGTISGTTLTSLVSDTATLTGGGLAYNGTAGTGNWFTIDLSAANLTLAANTTYYFEVAKNSGYWELANIKADNFAGGSAFTGSNNGALDADGSVTAVPNGGDYAFHANLTAIPEPGAALLGGIGMLALLRRRRA